MSSLRLKKETNEKGIPRSGIIVFDPATGVILPQDGGPVYATGSAMSSSN